MDHILELIKKSSLSEEVKARLLQLAADKGPSYPLLNAVQEAFSEAISAKARKVGVNIEKDPAYQASAQQAIEEIAKATADLQDNLKGIQAASKDFQNKIAAETDTLAADRIRSTLP